MGAVLSISLLAGCGSKQSKAPQEPIPVEDQKVDPVDTDRTINPIAYETVALEDSNIPTDLMKSVEAQKGNRGYMVWKENNTTLLVIMAGEKSTGGYSIEVESIEDHEGKNVVTVVETEPAAGDMTIQVITYPYVIVRLQDVGDQFTVITTKGETLTVIQQGDMNIQAEPEQQNDQPLIEAEGIYNGQIDNNSIEIEVNGEPQAFQIGLLQEGIQKLELYDQVKIKYYQNEHGQLMITEIR